jgi:hypothetical protein
MTKKVLLGLALAGLTTWAGGYDVLFKVRCPGCLDQQVLAAKQVLMTGGASHTNAAGVVGVLQSRTAVFHCPGCHEDFTLPVKPDIFVPLVGADAVAIAWTTNIVQKITPLPRGGAENPVSFTASVVDEVVRTINLPDGSQYVVIHHRPNESK